MKFVVKRAKPYERAMMRMGLGDAEMREVEDMILANPQAHPVVPGLRGARKARFARPGAGKRGGGRTIYFLALARGTLYMLAAYAKSEQENFSADERKAILAAIETIKEA